MATTQVMGEGRPATLGLWWRVVVALAFACLASVPLRLHHAFVTTRADRS